MKDHTTKVRSCRLYFSNTLPSKIEEVNIWDYSERLNRFFNGEIELKDLLYFLNDARLQGFVNIFNRSFGLSGKDTELALDTKIVVSDLKDDRLVVAEDLDAVLTPFYIKLGKQSNYTSYLHHSTIVSNVGWSNLPFLTSENNGSEQHNMWLNSGVTLVVGNANVGKSPLVDLLTSSIENREMIRLNEPHIGYQTDSAAANNQLMHCLVGDVDAVVIDSVKNLLSEGGALMSGGISREAMTDLSNLSIIALLCGVTIIIPLNPSSSNKEIVNNMVEGAKSNVTGVMWLDDIDTPGLWNYLTRTSEGGPRLKYNFSFENSKINVSKVGDHSIRIPIGGKKIPDFVVISEAADPDLPSVSQELSLRINLLSDFDQE